jgi:hypothetical protein
VGSKSIASKTKFTNTRITTTNSNSKYDAKYDYKYTAKRWFI